MTQNSEYWLIVGSFLANQKARNAIFGAENLLNSDISEVKLDVYGKRQKIKLLPSVFSSLYSRIKIFVFAVNNKRYFSIFV